MRGGVGGIEWSIHGILPSLCEDGRIRPPLPPLCVGGDCRTASSARLQGRTTPSSYWC